MSDLPQLGLNTKLIQINFTVIGSILIFCLSAVTAAIKIWGKETKPEDKPSDDNQFCQKEALKINQIEKNARDSLDRYESIRSITTGLEKEVAVLKNQEENTTKTMEEIKQTNREIANRLDDLLKQLMDWIS